MLAHGSLLDLNRVEAMSFRRGVESVGKWHVLSLLPPGGGHRTTTGGSRFVRRSLEPQVLAILGPVYQLNPYPARQDYARLAGTVHVDVERLRVTETFANQARRHFHCRSNEARHPVRKRLSFDVNGNDPVLSSRHTLKSFTVALIYSFLAPPNAGL